MYLPKKAKINFTDKDIDVNHADVGDKDGSGLRKKLKLALNYLSRLNWDTVAQGDMLFAGPEDIESVTIDGDDYIAFKPKHNYLCNNLKTVIWQNK